ncbi:MAG: hypothetical protein ACOYWZ_15505 [Bacillota bacterium]
MRILHKYLVVLVLFGMLMLHTNVYAADANYRFRHNDHDALIIGEIINVDESGIKVRVEKNIVSVKNLNEASPKKQLKLEEVKVVSSFGYSGFYNEDGSHTVDPSLGDYVLLSLDKAGADFKIGWGAYKVDSLDYKSLSVVLPENAHMWTKMNAAAVKAFVNSDGEITEFGFDGNINTVYAGKERSIIFDGSADGVTDDALNSDRKTLEDKSQAGNGLSTGVIDGADGPTAVFVSENPIKTLITPIIAFAVIILASGFAIGYIVKVKRSK